MPRIEDMLRVPPTMPDITVRQWMRAAHHVQQRRMSRHRDEAAVRLRGYLTLVVVNLCDELADLKVLRRFLVTSHPAMFGRPNRGVRGEHWTTPLIVHIDNRIAMLTRLEARLADPMPDGANFSAMRDEVRP